ncbi:uncharacterized protein LOC132286408 [Cornus florida]|uniref:uncharacterized protein LOC132286408 n=1 Tax=Cornus florida TaxID=4283 RepID=UPI002899B1DD|nr:uncharacterized protein LOC132286408 [Cornus florida]
MQSDTPLDYAVFQLSPKRSRCELFVSRAGNTEKLASGLVKPFVTHLKVAEEQVVLAVPSIKLEVQRRKNAETWFTKGTVERFVRFVSTPEVLELVNTLDAEMSQLEAARRIYSQGGGDQLSGTLGGNGVGATAAADATKKELLRAIDVRLDTVRQDFTTACVRAAAAGFTPDTVSELQLFANQFGAGRLNEACSKFISLCDRRPDLISPWKAGDDRAVRSSCGSDMSIDDDPIEEQQQRGFHQPQFHPHEHDKYATGREPDANQEKQCLVEQSKASTCQQPKSSFVTFPLRRSRESSIDKDDGSERDGAVENEKKEESVDQTESSSKAAQASRRLSVQDRINLFENKQKETSGSGGKPTVGKSPELRRLSSDVSSVPTAVEKAVLRRWSGVSDMSIDLSVEKKEIESPLCTPTSSSVSQTKSEDRKGHNDTTTSAKPSIKIVTSKVGDDGLKDQADSQTRIGVTSNREEVAGKKAGTDSGSQLTKSSGRLEDASDSNKWTSTFGKVESDGLKDQTRGKIQSRSSLGRAEDNCLKDQATSQAQFRSLPGGIAEQFSSRDRGKFNGTKEEVASVTEVTRLEDRAAPQTQFGAFASRGTDVRPAGESCQLPHGEFLNKVEDVGSRNPSALQSRIRAPVRTAVDSTQLEGSSGLKNHEPFGSQYKETDVDLIASQPRWRSLGEVEEVKKKDLLSSENQVEDSGLQRMKFQKQVSGSEQIKKSQGRRDESTSRYGSGKMFFSGKMVLEGQEGFVSTPATPIEQVQRVRQSKGNQELNNELKMKANELEKLFAEHKLRVPGDQSNSTWRSKNAEMQGEQVASLSYRKPAADIAPAQLPDKSTMSDDAESSSNVTKFNASPLMKMVDNQDYGDSLKQNFSEFGFSDDSRGKFYVRYMQKRDVKLTEDWSSKRAEKEAKMKAMQDSLERSRAEMKAKFSGSADRQNSVFNARQHAERLRSFNTRSTMKREEPLDFAQSEDDDDLSEFPEQKPYYHDRSFGETSLGDGFSRSTQSKKLFPSRNLSSSTPRSSASPIPRSAVKASNSNPGRRRMQSENPLAQSVPNFSDLRKENTKPSSGVSKTTARPLRNYARSKSISEEIPLVKEEKPRRSHSLRKSSASPTEFKDMSHINSEGIDLTPLKFDKQQSEEILFEKLTKNVESKPFLRKGNGVGSGTGVGIAKSKTSMASETMNHEDESDELAFEPLDSMDVAEDEEEEPETFTTEDHNSMNNGGPRLSPESDKLGNSVLENGDSLISISEVDPSLVTQLPAAVPSTFHAVGYLQDSPGESPVSWNSRMHHPFSYPHETSDIDASADSPIGSPASWNSHSLNQTEADAARIRKKWGSAQKPTLVANVSHNQSRKDVTKGFKRLLKFGRKTRGTESLVDWVSATTSEGDDDAEDGRDPANRSSEDLRKSRMGFSQGHPSDDSFNESEFFSEQVQALHSSIPAPPANFKLREDHLSGSSIKAPRSFFSLSSFRSKGSDSKPR